MDKSDSIKLGNLYFSFLSHSDNTGVIFLNNSFIEAPLLSGRQIVIHSISYTTSYVFLQQTVTNPNTSASGGSRLLSENLRSWVLLETDNLNVLSPVFGFFSMEEGVPFTMHPDVLYPIDVLVTTSLKLRFSTHIISLFNLAPYRIVFNFVYQYSLV